MSLDWIAEMLVGTTTAVVGSKSLATIFTQQVWGGSGIVGGLKETLETTIPILFPIMIAVAVLFGGYAVYKRLFHQNY